MRLGAVIAAQMGGVFNLAHRAGLYARVSDRQASPYFAWSNFATPPFEHDTAVSGAAGCTEARFCWDDRTRRLLLLCNDENTLVERASDDDGYTWGEATTRFLLASRPDILATRSGIIIQLAYRGGDIAGIRQAPAGATPSPEFIIEDDAAVDIQVEDDSFRLVEDHRGGFWLHVLPLGGSDTLLYYSHDIDVDGSSFTVTSGSVTGIAGGTHPGACVGPDGTLYAFAFVAGSGYITRRAPGDVNWSTPVEMEDEAGSPLVFADQPFSIAGSYEGPRRLVLAAVMDGESLPSEWGSSDDGATWTRFEEM